MTGDIKAMKLLDHIFLMRPVLLAPVWTILLLGFYHGSLYQGMHVGPFGFNLLRVLPVFILMTATAGGIYIINQIYDRESDRLNRKLFLIPEGHIKTGTAWRQATVLYVIAAAGAFFISKHIMAILMLSILLGFVYSTPPLSLKNRPWASLFSNILGHGIIVFAAGWFAVSGNQADSLLPMLNTVLPYSLAIGITFLCTTIPDMEGDRIAGKITFSVRYGKRKTALVIAVMFLVMMIFTIAAIKKPSGGCTLWHRIPLLLYAEILALPFFIIMVLNPSQRNINFAVKIPVFTLSIIVAVFFWWYFVLIFLVYLTSRLYYQKRFGLDYPSFKPNDAHKKV
jgi:4-hydroxybenzoate polyprenyltransferase